jgi:nicotinamidase-related amidase
VVIDMVPFFVPENAYCLGIVPNINAIALALRDAGGTVAWIVPGAGTPSAIADEFYGPDHAEVFRRSGDDGPLPGRLWAEMQHAPGDLFAEKTAASAFFPGRCLLPSLLTERGIDTVLIAGVLRDEG